MKAKWGSPYLLLGSAILLSVKARVSHLKKFDFARLGFFSHSQKISNKNFDVRRNVSTQVTRVILAQRGLQSGAKISDTSLVGFSEFYRVFKESIGFFGVGISLA